jgi:hypothetical protein
VGAGQQTEAHRVNEGDALAWSRRKQ